MPHLNDMCRMKEPHHIHSHTYVTYVDELCHTCECVIVLYTHGVPHEYKSCDTQIDEACHTHMRET